MRADLGSDSARNSSVQKSDEADYIALGDIVPESKTLPGRNDFQLSLRNLKVFARGAEMA